MRPSRGVLMRRTGTALPVNTLLRRNREGDEATICTYETAQERLLVLRQVAEVAGLLDGCAYVWYNRLLRGERILRNEREKTEDDERIQTCCAVL